MSSEITKPSSYTRRLEELSFDQQQEVMHWMSKNIIHALALEDNATMATETLVTQLSTDLDCDEQQLYYGLQWANEMGFIDDYMREHTTLLPQPHNQ